MAADRLFFAAAAHVHPTYRTPHVSLWLQGAWASLLALSGTFDQLLTYAIFAAVIMYGAGAVAVFTLRRTRPDLYRPYRVWGYPLLPAAYLAALGLILLNTIVQRPLESMSGLLLLAAGLPAYLTWKRRLSRATPTGRGMP